MGKSLGIAVILAMIWPGLGHIYLGYLKRGFAFMFLFIGLFLGAYLIIPIFIYSSVLSGSSIYVSIYLEKIIVMILALIAYGIQIYDVIRKYKSGNKSITYDEITCQNCGQENRRENNFCVKCGNIIQNKCSKCGAPIMVNTSYCGKCGSTNPI